MPSQPSLDALEKQLLILITERLLGTQPGFCVDSDLYEHGLDSMAIMQLLVLVEAEYGVAIPEGDLTRQNFSTTRQLAQIIRQRSICAA